MIYFIVGRLTHRIKIGYSKSSSEVDTRFHYLRRDNSDDLELLGRIDGEIADEQALHAEVEPGRTTNGSTPRPRSFNWLQTRSEFQPQRCGRSSYHVFTVTPA